MYIETSMHAEAECVYRWMKHECEIKNYFRPMLILQIHYVFRVKARQRIVKEHVQIIFVIFRNY